MSDPNPCLLADERAKPSGERDGAEQERWEFEREFSATAKSLGANWNLARLTNGDYDDWATEMSWRMWQASRQQTLKECVGVLREWSAFVDNLWHMIKYGPFDEEIYTAIKARTQELVQQHEELLAALEKEKP